jgi:hypothetical protein
MQQLVLQGYQYMHYDKPAINEMVVSSSQRQGRVWKWLSHYGS